MIGKDVKKPSGEIDDFVKDWNEQLNRGIKRRRKEERRWDHVEKYENMRQWDGEEGQGDEITVNKLGAFTRNYRAQVAYNDPRCKLTPKTADGWDPIQVPIAGPGGQPKMDPNGQVMTKEVIPAKAREALVNGILGAPMQNLQQTSGLLAKSGVTGYGIVKTGYNPLFSTPPKPESEQTIPIKDGRLDTSQYMRNKFDNKLVVDDNERLVSRTSVPIWEDFFVKWVPYRNMLIDPDGGNYWDDHRWVCEEELCVLSDVKADPLFENTSDLEASGKRIDDDKPEFDYNQHGSDWSMANDQEDERPTDIVRKFHIYDLINKEYIVLADGHGKPLRRVSFTSLAIDDHPYSDFRPNQVAGEFYPRALGVDLAPINDWYNLSRKYELIAMKRSPRKVITRKGVITGGNLESFTSDEDMAVIEMDIPKNTPLTDELLPFSPPPLGQDAYANTQIIGGDFSEVGGMTDEARGKATADSATQVNAMEQYSGTRIAHDRKIMAETWRRLFKKMNDYIDANMTTERAIMVQGTDGQVFQALVDPDMIAGDFDVDVDFQDLAENNTAAQAAGRTQIAQIAGQAPHLFMSEPLVRGWLEPYGIKDQNFIDALVESSQMQMQMLMAQATGQQDGKSPEADAPTSEAQAISQNGAGSQSRRLSSAS